MKLWVAEDHHATEQTFFAVENVIIFLVMLLSIRIDEPTPWPDMSQRLEDC